MNTDEQDRLKKLLQQALPPVGDKSEPALSEPVPSEPILDLWPATLRRLHTGPKAPVSAWAWFDIALLAGLAGAAAMFPAAIPVILYYL
jgi:hypothetical protein